MKWLFIDPILLMIVALVATKFFEGGSEVYGASKIKGIFLYMTGGCVLVLGFWACLKIVSDVFMKSFIKI